MNEANAEGNLATLPDRKNHNTEFPRQNSVLKGIKEKQTRTGLGLTFVDFQNIVHAEILDVDDNEKRFLKEEADSDLLKKLGSIKQAQQYFVDNPTMESTEIAGLTFKRSEIENQYDLLLPFQRKVKELKILQQYLDDVLNPPKTPLTTSEHQKRIAALQEYVDHHRMRLGFIKGDINDQFGQASFQLDDFIDIFDQLENCINVYTVDQNFLQKNSLLRTKT